ERDADPWVAARSVWPLLHVIDAALGEPWLDPLASYLGANGGGADLRLARRFGSARHLADLYDRYGVHRPAMLRAWAAKEDTADAVEPGRGVHRRAGGGRAPSGRPDGGAAGQPAAHLLGARRPGDAAGPHGRRSRRLRPARARLGRCRPCRPPPSDRSGGIDAP